MLERLTLQGFRNLEDTTLEVPAEGFALVGPNAQGKSNLLEAVHYLEIFRSFRGTRDTRLIRFGDPHFRLAASCREVAGEGGAGGGPVGGTRTVSAAVQRAGSVKRVAVDGEVPSRIGDALGNVGSVLFTPDDVRLVADGPQERRRFLDIVLSVHEPGYLEALQRYRQVLAQRNAALRDRAPAGGVEAWDGLLVASGARVFASRSAWVARGSASFASVVAEISGGERATLGYAPGLPEAPVTGLPGEGGEDPGNAQPEPWADAFAHALRAGADQERRRGTTLAGPHRDDLTLRLQPEGRDLREYGSGGQKRTAALALRILEAETVHARRGRPAILLLDDVFAELDTARSDRVLGLLDRTATGQVILTAPKEADVRLRGDRLPRWRILAGRIHTHANEASHDP